MSVGWLDFFFPNALQTGSQKCCHLTLNWWSFYVSLFNSWNYRPWSPVLDGSLIFERRTVIITVETVREASKRKPVKKEPEVKGVWLAYRKNIWGICCDDVAQGEEQGKGWSSQAPPCCPKQLDLTLVQQGSSLSLHVFYKTKQDVVGSCLTSVWITPCLSLITPGTHDKSK